MKELDEIGIVDEVSNAAYYQNLKTNGVTEKHLSVLNQDDDSFSFKEFWTAAAKIDSSSIVGGGMTGNIEKCNTLNRLLMEDMEVPSFLTKVKPKTVIDIGCGYGALKKFIPHSVDYWGFDVVCRTLGTQPYDGKNLPSDLPKDATTVIFNVCQHLTDKTIKGLLAKTTDILIISFSTNFNKLHCDNHLVKSNDTYYTYTCGQLVKVRSIDEVYDLLYNSGYIVYKYVLRYDGFISMLCSRNKDA